MLMLETKPLNCSWPWEIKFFLKYCSLSSASNRDGQVHFFNPEDSISKKSVITQFIDSFDARYEIILTLYVYQ